MNEKIIAHIRLSEMGNGADELACRSGAEQELKSHLNAVSQYAAEFAKKAGLEHCGRIVGLLHDAGKASRAFQEYIRASAYLGKTLHKVDHATAGARILHEYYYRELESREEDSIRKETKLRLIEILENIILGHHTGLYAYYSLNESALMERRLLKSQEEMFFEEAEKYFFSEVLDRKELDCLLEKAYEEFEDVYKKHVKNSEMAAGFLTKFLFSCLIDADRLDSFAFEEGKTAAEIFQACERCENSNKLWEEVYRELMEGLNKMKQRSGVLNQYRREISDIVEIKAKETDTSILTLNIPTGSGKTLTALRFALKHAIASGKKKIIYITNYLTIIEQNAQVFRKTLPSLEHSILEYHSNVFNEQGEQEKEGGGYTWENKQRALLQERWENPVIFTSVVQFLNTFFAGKNSYIKLHQLADSVIIFDEVQSLPVKNVLLFCQAVNFLGKLNATCISCTATQPHYQKLEDGFDISESGKNEMIPNASDYFEVFRRNAVYAHRTRFDNVLEIANFLEERMENSKSLLMITNTVKAALDIFCEMKKRETYDCYYLSTALCPAHRKKAIRDLRLVLKELREEEDSKRILCISTPIIEAGVDISFETVVRSLTGLDSLAQAAGRCNREKEREIGEVHIVQLTKELEKLNPLPEIKMKQEITKSILRAEKELNDILFPNALEKYFERLHHKQIEEYKFPIDLKDAGENTLFEGSSIFDILNSNQVAKRAAKLKVNWINQSDIRTAEKEFYVIPEKGMQVLVPYRGEGIDGKEVINELCSRKPLVEKYKLLRAGQQITISLFDHVFQELVKRRMIFAVSQMEGVYILNQSCYSEEFGFTGLENSGEITYLSV